MPDIATAPVLPGPITPPAPVPPDRDLSIFSLLRAYRTNILASWPRRAYEEWVLERPFFGRRTLLLNAPEAIRHVLVEATERYGRTPATLRVLRPLLGGVEVAAPVGLADHMAHAHRRRSGRALEGVASARVIGSEADHPAPDRYLV